MIEEKDLNGYPDEGYDPFAEVPSEEDAGGDHVPTPWDPGVNPNPLHDALADTRPAPERLADLLGRLGGQRGTCVGVLELCREPRTQEEVRDEVARLQTGNASVFGAGDLCRMLERAGGIERVGVDGSPLEQDGAAFETRVVDGVEYLEPVRERPVLWRTTDAGAAVAAAEDPAGRVDELIGKDARYTRIYHEVLTRASAEGGVAVRCLIDLLDSSPELQEPRRSCTVFVERLKLAGALTWDGAWKTTEVGVHALAQLDRARAYAGDEGKGVLR